MRKSQILLGSLALLSMGLYSCSSEEPANNGNNTTVDGDRYMAVRISTAGMGSTRAAGEGFEEGSTAEGNPTVSNTRFFFFDASGNAFNMESAGNVNGDAIASNMVTPIAVSAGNTDGNVPASSEAVLVLGKAVNQGYEGTVPAQAVCVVGLSATDFSSLAGKKLSELAVTVKEYEGDSFILTNSNWEGTNKNGAVTISDKIAATPDDAKANPAEFYLERLAVKVRVKDGNLKAYTSQKKDENGEYVDFVYPIYDANNNREDINLQVNLTDWQVIKKGNGSHLIKQLPESAWEGWSDAAYHRSYWAETPATASLGSVEFNIWENAGWNNGDGNDHALYTNEWTKLGNSPETAVTDRNAATTAVVIRGYIQKVPAEGEEASNLELVRWAGNYYYADSFQEMVATAYNNATPGANVAASDVTFVEAKTGSNLHKVQVKGADFAKYSNIQYWKKGATSFYLNIKNEKDWYGVVRNHIYEYEFETVIGLGLPGNEPENPEETETFVAAHLNVLNWKVVSNKVVLE